MNSSTEVTQQASTLTTKQVLQTWWPLALSQLLLTLGDPAQNAVMARLPDGEINLAAWGGVVFPITLFISAPIFLMITASNALVEDMQSYHRLRRFMLRLSLGLTLIHALIVFTPTYGFIARTLISAPEETVAPARTGLMIILPWTLAIAYRRFHQGLMIHFGHSQAVGLGTVIRLGAIALVLAVGYFTPGASGMVVGAGATVTGVIVEAVYAGLRARPIIQDEIPELDDGETTLTFEPLVSFYAPLVVTSVLTIFVQPIRSAAINRMPGALASQAAWPVVGGLLRLLRSPGFVFREAVVALLDEPKALPQLRRFSVMLGGASLALALLVTATPLAEFWLRDLMALSPDLINLGRSALWLAVLIPGIIVGVSLYQGVLTYAKETRAVTEAVGLYLLVIGLVLGAGIVLGRYRGLLVTVVAFAAGRMAQAGWLWWRSRPVVQDLTEREPAD